MRGMILRLACGCFQAAVEVQGSSLLTNIRNSWRWATVVFSTWTWTTSTSRRGECQAQIYRRTSTTRSTKPSGGSTARKFDTRGWSWRCKNPSKLTTATDTATTWRTPTARPLTLVMGQGTRIIANSIQVGLCRGTRGSEVWVEVEVVHRVARRRLRLGRRRLINQWDLTHPAWLFLS